MAVSPQQNERLLGFLNNELTPAEEEGFVQELGADEALQRAFDLELLLRAAGKTEAGEEWPGDPAFESAEAHLKKVKEALAPVAPAAVPEPPAARPLKVVPLWPRYLKIASAAAVVFVLIVAAYLVYTHKQSEKTIAKKEPLPASDSLVSPTDSGLAQGPQVLIDTARKTASVTAVATQALFEKNYTLYKSTGEDPPEASNEYNAYASGNNAAVLNKSEDGYGATLGGADSLPVLYLRFYKALSWLATGKPAKAAVVLDLLRQHTAPSLDLHTSAQWYLTLAYLKQGNAAAAKREAKALAGATKNSPYQAKARDLLKAWKG